MRDGKPVRHRLRGRLRRRPAHGSPRCGRWVPARALCPAPAPARRPQRPLWAFPVDSRPAPCKYHNQAESDHRAAARSKVASPRSTGVTSLAINTVAAESTEVCHWPRAAPTNGGVPDAAGAKPTSLDTSVHKTSGVPLARHRAITRRRLVSRSSQAKRRRRLARGTCPRSPRLSSRLREAVPLGRKALTNPPSN